MDVKRDLLHMLIHIKRELLQMPIHIKRDLLRTLTYVKRDISYIRKDLPGWSDATQLVEGWFVKDVCRGL